VNHLYRNSPLSFRYFFAALFLLLLNVSGCSLLHNRAVWQQPVYATPDAGTLGNWSLTVAEDHYLAATQLEAQGNADCVEHYFQVAIRTWPTLERELTTTGKTTARTADLYHSAVAKLVLTGQQFGRWQPGRGFAVATSTGKVLLPIKVQGFPWSPEEFHYLEPVGDYSAPYLSRAFRSDGLGVPLVVVRHVANPQPFTKKQQEFAATVLLRLDEEGSQYQLEFYDPLRESTLFVAGCPVALTRDITAPIARSSMGKKRQWLDDFLRPGTTGSLDGLAMIEPFQPGKIPVIFVHGLLSDPATWMGLVNELRNHPEFNERFQWWGFQYATGEPFLTSAAVLRRHLRQIRNTYDPLRQDRALSQMVLIGHSMGGLVVKLQVTASGDRLWEAIARQPLASTVTPEVNRKQLQEAFFFQPSVDVTRVVFMGTPHAGSSWARRPIGRLGSALVEVSSASQASHRQLTRDNPSLFREELQDRFPTSIDLLEPESPLLMATASLPFSSAVRIHSIMGCGKTTWKGEPSDGVVPVASARLLGVASEKTIDAKHEDLHRNPATMAEVVRILHEHLRCGREVH